LSTAKAEVSQHDTLLIKLFNQWMEILIRAVHGRPFPANYSAIAVNDPAQFDANRPAAFVLAFLPDLLLGASGSDREDQFNRVTVNHREYALGFQQTVTQMLVLGKLVDQRGAVRQTTKQIGIIPTQPTVEGTKPSAFECK